MLGLFLLVTQQKIWIYTSSGWQELKWLRKVLLDTQGERLEVLGFHRLAPADRRMALLAGPVQPLVHIVSPRKGCACQEACKQALAFQNTNTVQPVKKRMAAGRESLSSHVLGPPRERQSLKLKDPV